MTYTRFNPPHLLEEYVGRTGYEVEGLALSPAALEALAEEKMTGHRQLVVIGRWDYPKGLFYLDFGVTTAYIEGTSDYRYDENRHRLRLHCDECDQWDGKHAKHCAAA